MLRLRPKRRFMDVVKYMQRVYETEEHGRDWVTVPISKGSNLKKMTVATIT